MQDHQMSISSVFGLFFVGVIGLTIVFLVMREIFCWYVKSNKLVELLNKLDKEIQLLKFNTNSGSDLNSTLREVSDLRGKIDELNKSLSVTLNSNASISTDLCEKVEVLEARLNQIDDKLDEILEQIEQR